MIVADTTFRGAEEVDIAERLRAATPTEALMVLTLRGDKDTRAQAQEAGVQAFVDKCVGATDLLQAIRRFALFHPSESRTRLQPARRATTDRRL